MQFPGNRQPGIELPLPHYLLHGKGKDGKAEDGAGDGYSAQQQCGEGAVFIEGIYHEGQEQQRSGKHENDAPAFFQGIALQQRLNEVLTHPFNGTEQGGGKQDIEQPRGEVGHREKLQLQLHGERAALQQQQERSQRQDQ